MTGGRASRARFVFSSVSGGGGGAGPDRIGIVGDKA